MTSSIGSFNAYSYSSSFSSGSAGKLYVPVSKSALLYSHFDHVSGIAAKNGQNGVSISKIQILNALIDRLSSIKSQPKELVTEISNEQADVLIKNYQEQIQQAVKTTPQILAGVQPQAGELFQLEA